MVVLPAPLGPSSAKISPWWTSRSRPSTACTSPSLVLYVLRRSRTEIAGSASAAVMTEQRAVDASPAASTGRRVRIPPTGGSAPPLEQALRWIVRDRAARRSRRVTQSIPAVSREDARLRLDLLGCEDAAHGAQQRIAVEQFDIAPSCSTPSISPRRLTSTATVRRPRRGRAGRPPPMGVGNSRRTRVSSQRRGPLCSGEQLLQVRLDASP